MVLVVLLVAIVTAAVLVSRDINRSANEKYVDDAIPLKANVQDILVQMLNQQTAVRGYLISGLETALQPFEMGRRQVLRDLAYIGAHTEGHPMMASLLRRVTPQIQELHRYYDSQLALAMKGPAGRAEARRIASQGGGRFRALRATTTLMVADTDAFVSDAQASLDDRTDFLSLLLIVGGIAAVALAALRAYIVRRRMGGLIRDLEGERAVAEESRALLDTLVAEAPDGVAIFDRELRYVRANEALAAIDGVPAEDHLGRTPAEILPDIPEEGHMGPLRRVRETGEAVTDLEVSGRTAADPERPRHWLVSYFPIRPEEGADASIVALGAFVVDITERKASEERAALRSEASDVLGTALGVEQRLERLVALLVPRIADFATVEVVDPDGGARMLAAAHVDPAAERILRGLHPSEAGERSVLLREVTVPRLDWLVEDPEELSSLRALDPRSMLVVPMAARGRTLGRVLLATSISERTYGLEDLRMAEEVAGRAAVALDNARLYEAQREIAHTLQQSLLPPVLPAIAGIDLAARYHPVGAGMEVGGDFYDLFEMSHGAWAVVIGDVCGKGPRAAELTALARYTIRATGVRDRSPRAILETLNEAVVRQRGDTQFLTAVCACLEATDSGARLVMACAGHPPPLVLRGSGRVERTGLRGPLIGIYGEIDLSEEAMELGPGDTLLLYTDGVTEARGDGGFMDMDGLERELARCGGQGADAVASHIERAVLELQEGRPRDDVAIVVVQATGAREADEQAGRRSKPEAARA
jgi:PAS domain S-box-containing protein